MKKITAIVLSALLLISLCSVMASAASQDLKISVASDIHYAPAPLVLPVKNDDPIYSNADSKGQLYPQSYAIFDAYLNAVAASDAEVVLLSGDLVNNASIVSHAVIAGRLAAFENATGKRVFVIDGNNDISSAFSKDDFKSVYAAFGYDEAVAVDSSTCSYAVDLNSNYRLIAVDSCTVGANTGSISSELLTWIAQQSAKAKEDGKYPVVMMHHAVAEHVPYMSYVLGSYLVDNYAEIEKAFISDGIYCVFTGHFHVQDIAVCYSDNSSLYDIMTGTLTANDCPYRYVTFSDSGIKVSTSHVTEIDTTSFAYLFNAEQLNAMYNDFPAYTKGFYKKGVEQLIKSYMNTSRVASKLSAAEGSDLYKVIDAFITYANEFIYLPLYTADDGNTVSALASAKGITLPSSSYTNYMDLLTTYIAEITSGDENFTSDSTEYKLFDAATKQCCFMSPTIYQMKHL